MKKNDFTINCSPEEFLEEFVLDDCREEAKKALNTMLKKHFFDKLVYETALNRNFLGFSDKEADNFLNKWLHIEMNNHPVNKFTNDFKKALQK